MLAHLPLSALHTISHLPLYSCKRVMSAKFLESVGSKLAERWVATLLTPAFIFWAGGVIASVRYFGWTDIRMWFIQQLNDPSGIAFLIAGFCLIASSAFVVQRFDLSVLRFLEGYWHPWLLPLQLLRRFLIWKELKRSERISARWQQIKRISSHCRTAEQRDEFVRLDWKQQHLPLKDQLMPTRLGNLLRAAEAHSLERYGLDSIVCWPRLWLLLPEPVKRELQSARSDLDAAARVWFWCLLFTVWGIWVWWLALLGVLAAIFTYYCWATVAAASYGELIKATFDIYRKLLYDGLRWDLPADPREERRVGKELTEYLWRGF